MKHTKTFLLLPLLFGFATDAFSQKTNPNDEPIVFKCLPCGMECDNVAHPAPGTCPHCHMNLYATFMDLPPAPHEHMTQPTSGLKVGVLIFDQVEIIDYVGPYEVFEQAGMDVFTVAERDTVIETGFRLNVIPNYTFDNAPDFDIIVIPGGNTPSGNKRVNDWIVRASQKSKTTLSVCNGAFLLAENGLLDGLESTTFLALAQGLQASTPKTRVVTNKRFVDNGKIVTSAGMSSGIDAAFHIVSEYLGVGRTQQIAINFEYDWDPNAGFVRGLLADRHLADAMGVFVPFERKTIFYAGDQTHWTTKTHLKTEIAPERLARLVDYHLSVGQKWKRVSGEGLSSVWSFTDLGDQTVWTGRFDVEKQPDIPGEYLVTMRVERR